MRAAQRRAIRLDPGIWRDVEFAEGLSIDARAMWFSSLVYLATLGDERGTYPLLELVAELGPLADGVAAELVDFGLWTENDIGYLVHEYCGCRVVPETRAVIPKSVRALVYTRDGYRCVTCGSPENLTCDHIIPWSHGGSDDPDNLQTMCVSCNSRKGARI